MATTTNKANVQGNLVKTENNVHVKAKKSNVTDENGVVIRSMYNLIISNEKGEVNLSVGEKTYEGILLIATQK